MDGPRISPDVQVAFFGIFEALNWAVAVDNRLRCDHPKKRAWASDDPDGAIVAGFRYARNAVHHDWSEALELTRAAVLPSPLPMMLAEWMWVGKLSATRPSGLTQYRTRLAGQPVRFTLEALERLFSVVAGGA
jgi:hypothetical protein